MAIDERALQFAVDRILIHDLLGRYAFAIDYGNDDPARWAGLFTEDGRLEIPIMKVVVEGHAPLAAGCLTRARLGLTREAAGTLRATAPPVHCRLAVPG